MTLLRFLFGSGWWILWYLAFYLILLVSVAMTLLIFGQELKAAGEKPNTASPGSIMVLMIGLGLVAVTIVNAAILARVLPWPWYARAGIVVGLPLVVGVVTFPLNMKLATQQSHPMFWWNVAVSVAVVIGNLCMLWIANSPRT